MPTIVSLIDAGAIRFRPTPTAGSNIRKKNLRGPVRFGLQAFQFPIEALQRARIATWLSSP